MNTRYGILRAIVMAMVVTCTPSPVWAQPAMTIDQLVSLALEQSKRLVAARTRIEVARGERQQLGLAANPVIEVNQSEQIGGADRTTGLGVSWPLELFRLPARKAVGQEQVALAELDVTQARWRLVADVRREAARVMTAIRALEVIERQVSDARTLRDLVAASVTAGGLPRLDRDVAEVDLRRLEAARRMAEGAVTAAMVTLKGVIGIPQSQPLVLRSLEEEAASALAAKDALPSAGVGDRPDLASAAAGLRLRASQTVLERQQGRWNIDLTAGYMRNAMSFPQLGLSADGQTEPIGGRFHSVSFGAMVTVPLRNKNQGAVAAAAARESAAATERDALLVEAEAELAAARSRWEASRDVVDQYRDGLLTLARQNVDVVQQTYLAGRGTMNEVIVERRRVMELELTYTSLLGELLTVDAELRRAKGAIR